MEKEIRVRRFIWLTMYAIAMAYVEAALVIHLRHLYYADNPLAIFPLRLLSHSDLGIELVRELATLLMLLSVALLAERDVGRRFAAFVYVFGVWDLGYYACLKILIDWPQSWLEWDVLFLLPWPWFGPWLTPALIALLFTLWGAGILLSPQQPRFNRLSGGLFVGGSLLGLIAFLLPAASLLPHGKQAFEGYQPDHFPWLLFVPGFVAMLVSLIYVARNKSKA